MALAGVAQWIECCPVNWRLLVQFFTGVHAWVAPGPWWGVRKGQPYIDVFISLFLPPSPLSKNK